MNHPVVEVTAGTLGPWDDAPGNVEHLRIAPGPENTEVEVVYHSKGWSLLVTGKTPFADRIRKRASEGVVFAACRNTMHKTNVTKANLLPECITVDAGVAEVVRKQEAHWTFLKPDA